MPKRRPKLPSVMRRAAKRYPAVFIEWMDSAGPAGWVDDEDWDADLLKCVSLGFLVGKTKDAYIVACHVVDIGGHSEKSHGPLAIPRATVKKLHWLS